MTHSGASERNQSRFYAQETWSERLLHVPTVQIPFSLLSSNLQATGRAPEPTAKRRAMVSLRGGFVGHVFVSLDRSM